MYKTCDHLCKHHFKATTGMKKDYIPSLLPHDPACIWLVSLKREVNAGVEEWLSFFFYKRSVAEMVNLVGPLYESEPSINQT